MRSSLAMNFLFICVQKCFIKQNKIFLKKNEKSQKGVCSYKNTGNRKRAKHWCAMCSAS